MSNDDDDKTYTPYPGYLGRRPLRNIPANIIGYMRNEPDPTQESLPGPEVIIEGSFDGDSRDAVTAERDGDTLMIRGWRKSSLPGDIDWYVDLETGISLDVAAVTKLVPIAQAFLAANAPAAVPAPIVPKKGEFYWIMFNESAPYVVLSEFHGDYWSMIGSDEMFSPNSVVQVLSRVDRPEVPR